MNILHIKYAVEVARLGSVSKATETLFTAQPNISRSIRELENDLGIEIFSRSAKGMVLTPDGEVFINYARELCAKWCIFDIVDIALKALAFINGSHATAAGAEVRMIVNTEKHVQNNIAL